MEENKSHRLIHPQAGFLTENIGTALAENAGNAINTNVPEDVLTDEFRMLFKPSLRKTIRKIMIVLEAELTIAHVTEINHRFSVVLPHYDYFDFEIGKISAIDLAAVQLLHRLKTCYTAKGKVINIHIALEPKYRSLLNNAGLSGIC